MPEVTTVIGAMARLRHTGDRFLDPAKAPRDTNALLILHRSLVD